MKKRMFEKQRENEREEMTDRQTERVVRSEMIADSKECVA